MKEFKITEIARFWKQVQKTDTCWNWTGCFCGAGYGQAYLDRKQHRAHRISYQICKGEIPKGLVIDHLCRNKKCVNPEHLEAVTQKENTRRGVNVGRGARKHCSKGHLYVEGSYYKTDNGKSRWCKICSHLQSKNNRLKTKMKEKKQLLLLVMNVLTDKFDKMESQDIDQSTAKWRSYKGIRNTIRDEINKIAESKGINLEE